ncbi:phage tail tube protein [uncultured Brevundimonas sp.]|uniref:phage tail tube protein n=1 Tax=uncultured Brevundimonas sp. TaxID=213418 RepID=UPI0025FE0F37|nr:phage tail tube protein [uncultured Brevundimonas sp.]
MPENRLQQTQGQRFFLEQGNGASPEVFTRVGLINTNFSFSAAANLTESEIPDLNDFDKPFTISREVRSIDVSMEGSGNIDHRYVYDMLSQQLSGTTKNYKIRQDNASTGWTLTCPYILETFTVDAPYKEQATCSISLKQNGTPVLTKNA